MGLPHIVVSKFWYQPYMVGGGDKNTSAQLWAKNAGGLMREGGLFAGH